MKAYFVTGNAKGIRSDWLPRVRNILTALAATPDMETLEGPPGWRIHQLKGYRAGDWSISVSGNWRLTFQVTAEGIENLNLEDYH